MNYRFTYKDWEEGKINWNSIESNKYEKDYISESCKKKIQLYQQQIFENESYRLVETFIADYSLNRRKDTNRSSTLNKLLETIDNLFNGEISNFADTVILDEEQAMTESLPIEFNNKVIPPLNIVSFNEYDIIGIQDAYSEFYTSNQWNFEVIETPNPTELWKHVDFRNNIFSRAYHDFSVRLRQYEGVISNTFQSNLDEFLLARLRVDLIKYGFISKDTNRELFIKCFHGYYLLSNERFNWLKSLDCLRYFIVCLNGKVKYSKEYGKWKTVTMCFIKERGEINLDTLRKANKIENSPIERNHIDKALSSIK